MSNNSRFYFILLSVLSAAGVGNIFIYPNLSAKFGGLFFIPYLIAMIVLGVPLLMLEFSIGQHFDKNVVDIFASVKKWFSGIGWLMMINAFIIMSIYTVVLAWNIIYIFVSFGLQWKGNERNYFLSNVVQASGGLNGFTKFSLPVFIALVIVWAIIFFYVRNGFDSIMKCFLIMAPAFLVLALFFLYYTLTIQNALNGVYFFLNPGWAKLLDWQAWSGAFLLAALSLGVSFGIMPAVSRRSKTGFAFGNSFFVIVFKLMISMIIGIIVFSIIGFLGARQNIGLEGLSSSGYGFPFITLAQALPFFYSPALLSILFFTMLFMLLLFGASSLAYSLVHILSEKLSTKRRNAAIVVAGLGFLSGLLFVIKPGLHIMDIVSHFVAYNILLAVLLESVAAGWFYNSEKLSGFVNKNSAIKIGGVWRFFIRFIIPIIVIVIIAIHIKSDFGLDYNSYPLWAILSFGIGTVAIPVATAFLLPEKILDRKG
ncbi:MAG TPA: hypothetical protein VJI52_05890 [Candidatus Nanoarchaeia archaeon]|nr:hypothetical protein [Candidatus Nanoarchaeia archaeon]